MLNAQLEQNHFEIPYEAPFTGFDVSMPENKIQPSGTPDAVNFFIRNGQIITRNRIGFLIPGPSDNLPVRALANFVDTNNVWHTVCLTQNGLWQLNPNWQTYGTQQNQAWNLVGSFTLQQRDVVFATAVFLNKFYFTNGGNSLYYWDGIKNFIQTATTIAGGFFFGELDAHLVMASTVEGTTNTRFAQRFRWSQSGSPTVWDPGVSVGAGFNDLLDVPDFITGLLTIGRIGYLFRTNGITEVVPVGKGVQPFDFNHMWASERGVGNVFVYSIAQYGPTGYFVSTEDIHEITPQGFRPIGGRARDAIYSDLNNANGQVIGSVLPVFQDDFPYLCYKLDIPVSNGYKTWLYNIMEHHWMPWMFTKGLPTAKSNFVFTA